MTPEEELLQLRREKSQWQEQLAQRDERIAQMQQQLELLSEQVQVLQEQLKKDSHNSHLPPSSDRFHRQPKSLRKKSGKKAGGQPGHPGTTLMLSPTPDTVIMHAVEQCVHCQRDLREIESLQVERRQVIDLPVKRVLVIEHQAEQKCCPTCQQISSGTFPENVSAPVQYGAAFGAVGVYLVQQQLLPYERACEVMQERHGTDHERGHAANAGAALCRAPLPGRTADQSRALAGGRAAPG
jgi:transposase